MCELRGRKRDVDNQRERKIDSRHQEAGNSDSGIRPMGLEVPNRDQDDESECNEERHQRGDFDEDIPPLERRNTATKFDALVYPGQEQRDCQERRHCERRCLKRRSNEGPHGSDATERSPRRSGATSRWSETPSTSARYGRR